MSTTRRWHPFQLQPHMPRDGMAWQEFIRTKFGGPARARAIFDHVMAVGASVGVTFDFDRVASVPNAADAHRVILFAAELGDEWPVVDLASPAFSPRVLQLAVGPGRRQ